MAHEVQLSFPPAEHPPAHDDAELTRLAARKLRVAPESIVAVRTRKVSFDARPRHRQWRVSLTAFEREDVLPEAPRTTPRPLDRPREDAPHVVVIGSGPAGLFAALDLVEAGLNVTVLERGRDVQTRRKALRSLYRGEAPDPDSNYCFGEGGAGTYSDGKLYTRSGNKKAVRGVVARLVEHGAPEDILVSWRPHVGSNRLPEVVRSMRETLVAAGARIAFGTRATDLEVAHGKLVAVRTLDLDAERSERIAADACVLATGHSALDALQMAARAGAHLEPKGFAMGVRAEHAQPWLDERQYGGLRGPCDLPASFYELTTEVEERGVYSFCMCPGGFIVPAAAGPGRVVVNGMSLSRRDSPYANSGIVVAIEPEDWCGERGRAWGWDQLLEHALGLGADLGGLTRAELPRVPQDDPLFGVRLQHALETLAAAMAGGANRAPGQRTDAILDGGTPDALPTSYRPGVAPIDLADLLPPGMFDRLARGLADFDRKLPGFVSEHGQALGVESRTSSPVRIARDDETLQSLGVEGLYPCGEGAGFAGGIVSAAIDGRRVAESIAARLAT